MTRRPPAAQMLTDIHAWLPAHDEATTWSQPSTTTTATTGAGREDAEGRLPYRLASRLDQLDDGMPGARTATGVTTILTGWADHVAAARGEPRTTHPAIYLAATAHWWTAEYGDADALLDDITTAWDMLATTTGHRDQTDPAHRCPACGGTLTQAATPRGLSDWRTCTVCDTWYPDGDIIDAARHHTVTTTTDSGPVWVTRQHALALHDGSLTPARLRQWIHRGHVQTRGRLVSLTGINRRLQQRSPSE